MSRQITPVGVGGRPVRHKVPLGMLIFLVTLNMRFAHVQTPPPKHFCIPPPSLFQITLMWRKRQLGYLLKNLYPKRNYRDSSSMPNRKILFGTHTLFVSELNRNVMLKGTFRSKH